MAHLDHPPPKLTKELTRAINDRLQGEAPSAPLDWVAARAGVRRATVKRWCKRAYRIRNQGYTGNIARKWIGFIDAVDALCSYSADATVRGISEIADAEDNKKRLDALVYLDKRRLRDEDALDLLDAEPVEETSVAHIPQEYFDALTDEERDAQEKDIALLSEVHARISARWDAAATRVNEAATDLDA